MNGQKLFDIIQRTYDYQAPQLVTSTSTATAAFRPVIQPSLTRLPAFLISDTFLVDTLLASLVTTFENHIQTGEVDFEKLQVVCRARQMDLDIQSQESREFKRLILRTEGDVTDLAAVILGHVGRIMSLGYGEGDLTSAQVRLMDQTIDRILKRRGSAAIIWEDEGHSAFKAHASALVRLSRCAESKKLQFTGNEENERAILYKLVVAMSDTKSYWGFLFGGNKAMVFQRIDYPGSARYGVVCSDIIDVQHILLVVLAMLLVPGSTPLVDVALFSISVLDSIQVMSNPEQDVEEDWNNTAEVSMNDLSKTKVLRLHFTLSEYEPTTIFLSRSTSSTLPSSEQSSPDSPEEPVTLHIQKSPAIGATGIVFKATAGSLALVVKAVPPGWKGEDHLRHEVRIYEALASLQGSVIPKMVGCFDGGGWTVFVAEDCGSALTDDNIKLIPLGQRETLWQHACSIHRNGVYHGDLEPRNLVVSDLGAVRIIDFAYSQLEHDCEEATCSDLCRFRELLDLV